MAPFFCVASVTWREIDDEGKPTGEVSLDSQSFSTPGTEFLYHVNYPAGTSFFCSFRMSSLINLLRSVDGIGTRINLQLPS